MPDAIGDMSGCQRPANKLWEEDIESGEGGYTQKKCVEKGVSMKKRDSRNKSGQSRKK